MILLMKMSYMGTVACLSWVTAGPKVCVAPQPTTTGHRSGASSSAASSVVFWYEEGRHAGTMLGL